MHTLVSRSILIQSYTLGTSISSMLMHASHHLHHLMLVTSSASSARIHLLLPAVMVEDTEENASRSPRTVLPERAKVPPVKHASCCKAAKLSTRLPKPQAGIDEYGIEGFGNNNE